VPGRLYLDRKICREVLTVAVGQGLAVAGVLFGIRVLSTLLRPNVYGQVALAMTIAALVTSAAAGPVGNAAGRLYSPALEHNRPIELWQATRRFFFEIHLGVLVLGIAVLACVALLVDRAWVPFGVLVLATSLLGGANVVLDSLQNAARHRGIVAWHQACGQWGRGVFAMFLVYHWGPTGSNVLCGYLTAAGLVFASQMTIWRSTLSRLTVFQRGVDPGSTALVHEMRKYGLPFAAWGAIAWLQQNSDRWFLVALTDIKEVGVYQILYQLGYYPLALLSGLVGQLLGPVLFGRAGDGNDPARLLPVRRLVRRLGIHTLVGTFVMTIMASFSHRMIFALLVPQEYRAVSHFLPLVVLASGLFATGQVLAFDALIQMRSHALMAPKIGCALLATALNYVGALTAGLAGVVYANVLSSAAYAAWIFALTLQPTYGYCPRVESAELLH